MLSIFGCQMERESAMVTRQRVIKLINTTKLMTKAGLITTTTKKFSQSVLKEVNSTIIVLRL